MWGLLYERREPVKSLASNATPDMPSKYIISSLFERMVLFVDEGYDQS